MLRYHNRIFSVTNPVLKLGNNTEQLIYDHLVLTLFCIT